MIELFSNDIFVYFIIPILILLARVIDVTLGTIRIILANKGIKLTSAIIGFFEVLVWLTAITTIMQNLTNVVAFFAYATGFSLGTYLGIYIEEKISIGQVRLIIITKKNLFKMINDLKLTQYAFISNSVNKSNHKIKIINAFLERKNLSSVIKIIKEKDPKAFYSVEDLKMISRKYKEKTPLRTFRKMK